MIEHIPYPRHPKKLPMVLSRADVAALLTAPRNLKHRAILTTLYAAGLRVSELRTLQLSAIESPRMVIRVRQGKGQRDRLVMLAPRLLHLLRQYWKQYRPPLWLFPGRAPTTGVSLLAVWCLSGATPRGQPWTSAVTLPPRRNGLSARRMTVLSTFREPFSVLPRAPRMHAQCGARCDPYNTRNCLPPKKLCREIQ
jgi:Phage integrase family